MEGVYFQLLLQTLVDVANMKQVMCSPSVTAGSPTAALPESPERCPTSQVAKVLN